VQNLRASLPYTVNTIETEIAVRCPYCISGDELSQWQPLGTGDLPAVNAAIWQYPATKTSGVRAVSASS
jgi:hypothetical protein